MSEERPERPDRPSNGRTPVGGGMHFSRGLYGWMLIIGLLIAVVVLLNNHGGARTSLDFGAVLTEISNQNVQEISFVDPDEIRGKLFKPKPFPGSTTPVTEFRATIPGGAMGQPIVQWILDHRNDKMVQKAENSQNLLMTIVVPLIPWLLIFGFIWFFVFRQLRNGGGGGGMLGNFGRSRHRITSKEHTNVTFGDVAGVEEAKEEVVEIVEFLKNPKKFQRLGGRIPRGVLLVGEPGTGKTLLAKAIAGEADVPFFSISGSDFVEMFVGVGASRVRDLFHQAKDNSPCIIFLDEIDAVGRRRGNGVGSGGHDEREQTLNAILVEMDGFDTNDQVIVIAATNRVDVLDPALTRPGRFDRQIYVALPDVKGRLEILKVHSRKVKLGPGVDLMRLARATPGFSGADLAAIINEAALRATLTGKDFIEMDDLEESRDKVRWGRARKSRVIDEQEKLSTAYHEAGHTVVEFLTPNADPIHKVTIIPRGQMGGATMSLPEKDRSNYSRNWCVAFIKVCLGGRIAEEMFCGDMNNGVASDIRQATGLARHMIREWGMNDRLGFVYYGEDESHAAAMSEFGMSGPREYSEETAKVIDEEVRKMIDQLYAETKQLLMENRDRVEAIARALVKYETLDTNDVDRIMKGQAPDKPAVGDGDSDVPKAAPQQPVEPETASPDVTPNLGLAPG